MMRKKMIYQMYCIKCLDSIFHVSFTYLLVHGLSSELLGNHISHDSHHSSTSVVKLGIQLAGLLLRVKDVVSEVTNTVVSVVLGSRPPGKFNKSNSGDDLGKSGGRNSEKSVNSGGDIRELKVVGGRDVSIEYNVVVVYNASYNGGHSNTSVLTLNGTTTLESLRLSIEPSKRIVNSKGLGGSKLDLTNLKRGGGLYLLHINKAKRHEFMSQTNIPYSRRTDDIFKTANFLLLRRKCPLENFEIALRIRILGSFLSAVSFSLRRSYEHCKIGPLMSLHVTYTSGGG